ncbi:MAG: serine/threonine protein kinase [Phycisphaerales bacterium]|nr:serine/threonine protein kinase [Phycisphaerales bacterium]
MTAPPPGDEPTRPPDDASHRVREVFEAVLGLAGRDRTEAIERLCAGDATLCAEVEALLDALASADEGGLLGRAETPAAMAATADSGAGRTPRLERAGADPAAPGPDEDPSSLVGRSIGRYRILGVLGEGGFGAVYRAEQHEPVRREVALKIIKRGMDSRAVLARFEAERQALAMMDHPCVAKVFDGGTADDGRPYFVMELVRGEPVTTYCNTHRLPMDARVRLMARVCDAVQHAHGKGVIHRDLKPSNILVDTIEGQPAPKVIDFGIAKALDRTAAGMSLETQQGQLIGTPDYMSPEQAAGEVDRVDTRTDVYALGVVLYELLTGARPFDLTKAALFEMQRVICEQDPPRPSTRFGQVSGQAGEAATAARFGASPRSLGNALRRDLDWVVLRCLEKQADRRYPAASDLASDLRRYLSGQPVEAGPPSATYRLGKFVRRNRGGVAAGVAILVLLVAGAVGTSIGMVRAIDAREAEASARKDAEANERLAVAAADRAERAELDARERADDLEQVAAFQEAQLAGLDPQQVGDGIRERLDDAVRALGADPEQPDAMEPARRALERVNFTDIASQTLEQDLFDPSIRAVREQFADQPEIRGRLLHTLGTTIREVGLLDRAIEVLQEAVRVRSETLGPDDPDTLVSQASLGRTLQYAGRPREAEALFNSVLEARLRVFGDHDPATLDAMDRVADIAFTLGRQQDAERLYRQVLDARIALLGPDHLDTINSHESLARICRALRLNEEAERHHRIAAEGFERIYGFEHEGTQQSLSGLAGALTDQGRAAEAEAIYRRVVAFLEQRLGRSHPNTLVTTLSLVDCLQKQDRHADAADLAASILERAREQLPPDHWYLGSFEWVYSISLVALGRFAEAEALMLHAYQLFEQNLGPQHVRAIATARGLTNLYEKWDAAEPDAGHAEHIERWRTLGWPDAPPPE